MSTYDDGNNVLVRFEEQRYDTEAAVMLKTDDGETFWLPKSQIAHIDEETGEVWIPLWLAEKEGLEYE